jgi:hypothetical protein
VGFQLPSAGVATSFSAFDDASAVFCAGALLPHPVKIIAAASAADAKLIHLFFIILTSWFIGILTAKRYCKYLIMKALSFVCIIVFWRQSVNIQMVKALSFYFLHSSGVDNLEIMHI